MSTASYEARRFGIHSAQSLAAAKRLCPQLVVVEPHYHIYKEVSQQIHEIFRDYTDLIEPLSLDEAFLDVTNNKRDIALAVDCAKELKARIKAETGLTASAGVSYCKLLAKIASDYRKPNGLCIIHPDRAQEFINRLRVERIWGVGRKTAEHMHRMGIFTGVDLQRFSLEHLTKEFGKMGRLFYNFARGIDERPVITEWERKSVSCEQTFQTDLSQPAQLTIELYHTVQELVRRIAKAHFNGHTLTLKIKFNDFRQITRSTTVNYALCTKDQILPLAKQLMSEVDYRQYPIRLIGLGVSGHHDEMLIAATPQWIQLELNFQEYPTCTYST